MTTSDMELWRAVFKKWINAAKPGDAWKLTADQTLEFYREPPGWKTAFHRSACARFTCFQCHYRWTSYRVAILFHVHWEPYKRQGRVRMRVFKQQCHECFPTEYTEPEFTQEGITDVVKHLVSTIRKKCYRENVDDREVSEPASHQTGPHKRDCCEACQLGIHKGDSRGHRDTGQRTEISRWKPSNPRPLGSLSKGVVVVSGIPETPLIENSNPPLVCCKRWVYILIGIVAILILVGVLIAVGLWQQW